MTDFYLLSKYIASFYRHSKNQINHQINDLDIRATQGDLLLFIDEHPHLSQKQIAQEMQIDPSLLGRDLAYLEKRNVIERVNSERDSRVKEITVIITGHNNAKLVRQKMNQWWENFFKTHPEIDRDLFIKQFKLCYQAIRRDLKDEEA